MINRLPQQFLADGHFSTFRQKFRDVIMRIFGHEALFDTSILRTNSHCTVFNTDIYRLAPIKLEHLAWRKLCNPFKWIEILIVLPLEMLSFWFYWSPNHLTWKWIDSLNKWKNNITDNELTHPIKKYAATGLFFILKGIEWVYWNLSHWIIAPVLNLAANIITGFTRRLLAPARFIIRPSLEMMQTEPVLFFLTLTCAMAIIGALIFSFVSGGLIWGVLGTGSLLASKILITSITISVWPVILKFTTILFELAKTMELIKGGSYGLRPSEMMQSSRIEQCEQRAAEQKVKQFQESGSTDKIARMLHAMNSEVTDIRPIEEQDCYYQFALFLGIECLFYKKNISHPRRLAGEEDIIYGQDGENLKKYGSFPL